MVNAEAADMLVVSARESGDVADEAGISLFLVPATSGGLTVQGYALLAGGRAAEVTLDDVRLPEEARLGTAGEAFASIEARIAAANSALCAETLGRDGNRNAPDAGVSGAPANSLGDPLAAFRRWPTGWPIC